MAMKTHAIPPSRLRNETGGPGVKKCLPGVQKCLLFRQFNTKFNLESDQLNMAVCFWYLVKRDLYISVH